MLSLNPNSLQRLKNRLDNTIVQARTNPYFGLPSWVDESFSPEKAAIIVCGTGFWATVFLNYAPDLAPQVLAVVDDYRAGETVLNHRCISTAELLEMTKKRPEIICINTAGTDAGYSHFERLGTQLGLRMMSYHQAVRAFKTTVDIRAADWKNEILSRVDEILALEEWLVDRLSVETLYSYVLYHLETERDLLLSVNRPGDSSYFHSGLFTLSDREVYADCGAYTGDSVQTFIQAAKGNFRSIHAFEPDPENFRLMQAWHAKHHYFGYASRIHLHQKAVGRAPGTIVFNQTGGPGACVPVLDEKGEPYVGLREGVSVDVVNLDSVIQEPLTLAKLDVEGHEIEILHGAEQHLRGFKPKLAICAYHMPSDLIELPKFLRNLDVGYGFGLRHHSNCRFDTTLYAF